MVITQQLLLQTVHLLLHSMLHGRADVDSGHPTRHPTGYWMRLILTQRCKQQLKQHAVVAIELHWSCYSAAKVIKYDSYQLSNSYIWLHSSCELWCLQDFFNPRIKREINKQKLENFIELQTHSLRWGRVAMLMHGVPFDDLWCWVLDYCLPIG